MKSSDIRKLLNSEEISKSKGIFKYWKSYYWGVTNNADRLVEEVRRKIPNARIIDSGNHYHSFVGGAKSGSPKDSYLWVKFTVN